jgi:hypothetical protein
MPGKKYSFGQASLMKAIEPGQKATIKFLGTPKTVETEWGNKLSVDILLLSHPLYSIPSSKGIKMTWQTSAKVLRDVVDMLTAKPTGPVTEKGEEGFEKDYYDMTWELTVAEDGSYWLNA